MSLFLDALAGKELDRFPVWIMRQAGRYMPSYQAIRKKNKLYDLFHNPEIAAEITMLPINELGVDAAILFSDILMILKSIGLEVHYPDSGGPYSDGIENIVKKDVEEVLSLVPKTIELCKRELTVPLIGFAGGPFTVASYALEEKGRHAELHKTKAMMMRDPKRFTELLDLICEQTITYLKMQVKAGAQVVQLFDSWAGILALPEYRKYSLSYLSKIMDAIDVPVIYFSRGSCLFAPEIAKINPGAISLDWQIPMSEMRAKLGPDICLQGNFDPTLLYSSPSYIEKVVSQELDMLPRRNTIINLGHGVLPNLPYEHVKTFVSTVQGHKLLTTSNL
ncbi:MAG: uroporphyrinogen decarboxylase [Rhabdochlamydiaceae bacterium]|nr:uroporphyrinogen decarboxylase [Candidatus Amphrikana amoebophyrae]